MLTIRDHATADLFGMVDHFSETKRLAVKRSWAGVFRDHLLKQLPALELAAFSQTQGRPSKDMHAVMGALILQQLHALSGAATVEAYAFNQGNPPIFS